MAKDSEAYGVIGAIFAAIGSFSPENKQRILASLASKNPAEIIAKFEEPFKNFTKNISEAENSGLLIHCTGEELVNDCIEEVETFTKLSDDEKGGLRQALRKKFSSIIADEFAKFVSRQIPEIENGFLQLAEDEMTHASLEKYNDLYSRIVNVFFVSYKDVGAEFSDTVVMSNCSLDTPAHANIISFDRESGKFVSGDPKYEAFAKMATTILHRRDEIAKKLNMDPLRRR
jgi:hypothetical protein